jgi:galactokinase
VPAAAEFRARYGRPPAGLWAAPGRINLIGEHTDYNDGLVLPLAVDRTCVAAVGLRDDGVVRAFSAQLGDGGSVRLADLPGVRPAGWVAYVAGVVWALREAGVAVDGADVVVDSAVPIGAGLASSAALACSVALGLAELAGSGISRLDLARAAQRAEREVAGAPVGLMDQAVALLARAGHAMLLDCRSYEVEHVPLPPGYVLLVVDTGVTHAHATGGYAQRRSECAAAAGALGVPSLRDARIEALDGLDPVLRRRARHVVTENSRVRRTAGLLRDARMAAVGDLLTESHHSLRVDFEVSVPELDLAVAAACEAGALGARMTGGGFGGSALALVPADAVSAVSAAVLAAFSAAGFRAPHVFVVTPSPAAARRPS